MNLKTITLIALIVSVTLGSGCINNTPDPIIIYVNVTPPTITNFTPTPTPIGTPAIIPIQEPIIIQQVNYNDAYWNETTPETVKEFLEIVPMCDWYKPGSTNICGLRTRYLCLEGRKHGIELNAVTLKYITGTMGGHRVPVFNHNETTYYCSNLYSNVIDNRVVNLNNLHRIIKDDMDIDKFGFCDYKSYNFNNI